MNLEPNHQLEKLKHVHSDPQPPLKLNAKDLTQVKDYVFHPSSVAGRGIMSIVYKAVNIKTNEVVAVKKVSKKALNSEYLVSSLLNEINIHTKIDHPNIVGLKDVIRSANNIYLILEYCNHGTLRDYMKLKGKISEKEAKQILNQIIQGMDFLIKNNIVHRDIKPENILCNSQQGTITFKICDFGFSKVISEKDVLLQSAIGSPQYMDLQRLSSEGYSTKSDVFSLGIIAYEMLFGCPPWSASNWHDLKYDLMSKPLRVPEGVITIEMEIFLRKALAIMESDRASWDEIKKYSIFEKF